MKYVIEIEDQGKPLYWLYSNTIYTTRQALEYCEANSLRLARINGNYLTFQGSGNAPTYFNRAKFCET